MVARFFFVWLVWLISFGWLYLIADQHGVDFHIGNILSDFLGTSFGFEDDPYSYPRFIVPRLMSFVVITAPSAAVGILSYHRLIASGPRWGLRSWAVVVTAIAALLAVHSTEPTAGLSGRWQAAALITWSLVVTIGCLYLAAKRVDPCTTR